MWTSDKRLYLAPDGTVTEEPVSGGSLLVPLGGELPDEEARLHGLIRNPEEDVADVAPTSEVLESKPLRAKRKG